MYQRPKSCDWGVISVGRSGSSVSVAIQVFQQRTSGSAVEMHTDRGHAHAGGYHRLRRTRRVTRLSQFVADVSPPVLVVTGREIRPEVAAAALLASQRSTSD